MVSFILKSPILAQLFPKASTFTDKLFPWWIKDQWTNFAILTDTQQKFTLNERSKQKTQTEILTKNTETKQNSRETRMYKINNRNFCALATCVTVRQSWRPTYLIQIVHLGSQSNHLRKNRIKHSHSHIQNIHTHSKQTFLIKNFQDHVSNNEANSFRIFAVPPQSSIQLFSPSDHIERGHPTKVIEILLPLKRRRNDEWSRSWKVS